MNVVHARHRGDLFKRIFAAVKDVLTDVNLQFTLEGIKIVGFDPDKITVAKVWFTQLDVYECNTECFIGVYMPSFYKLFRNLRPDDYVDLVITDDEPDVLKVSIEYANATTTASIKSGIIPVENFEILSAQTFDNTIAGNVMRMYKVIKDVSMESKKISMCTADDSTVITVASEGGEFDNRYSSVISANENSFVWTTKGAAYKGIFYAKFLEKFFKPSLNAIAVLSFSNGQPLYVNYSVDNIAVVEFFVATLTTLTE